MYKKVAAILLSLLMILSVLPMGAFAAIFGEPDDTEEPVEAIESTINNLNENMDKVLEERAEQAQNNTVEITGDIDEGLILEDGKTYIFKNDVTVKNKAAGDAISLSENATAIIQIEKGVTVTATGSNASMAVGAGAGVRVPESSTLIIKGEGTLKATGGNAAKGEKGSNGENALFNYAARGNRGIIYAGNGGSGGNGGGGAAAGIGGRGGNGGAGGKGGVYPGCANGKYTFPRDYLTNLTLLSPNNGVQDSAHNELTTNLFDDNVNTKYCVYADEVVSVIFKSSEPEKVISYSLFTANDTSRYGRLPQSWTFYGSDNGVNWKLIDRVDNPGMNQVNLTEFNYKVANPAAYKYYRINIRLNECLQLGELKLYTETQNHPASPCESKNDTGDCDGRNGENGKSGERGEKCGNVYLLEKVNVIAVPGRDALGQNGGTGTLGKKANDKGSGYKEYYTGAGGAGGGGGTGGLAPEYGIGSGGDGGAGGGGGGAGGSRFTGSNVYDDNEYARGGKGGTNFGNGEDGRQFGSQRGGNGGKSGAALEKIVDASGNVCLDRDAKVEGRLDGDLQKGIFIINEDGSVVNVVGESVTDLNNLKLENNKLYRFDKNISFTAEPLKNAITIPNESKIIFEIPTGKTVTLKGGNAQGTRGAGAGIYVPASSTLIIRGSGTLNVQGGDAANASKETLVVTIGCGGGAGAGIGGKGGKGSDNINQPERGTDCGTIYIMGTINLNAESGKAGTDSAQGTGGRAADYGIGGGGAGGNVVGQPVQLSGQNGNVFIDYASVNVKGRDSFYHRADLAVDIMGDVEVSGYTDMILGTKYSDGVRDDYLYYILREVANHNALKENKGWLISEMPEEEGNQTNKNCNRAYRSSNNDWNKNFIDISGGYVYLFATYFGRYASTKIVDRDNPKDLVNRIWNTVNNYANKNNLYINNDMKTLMSELLFWEHYGEPFGVFRTEGYTEDHMTKCAYSKADDAIQVINYSYTTVLDLATARYATISYDTYRHSVYKFLQGDYWFYKIGGNTFTCIDGYKGVTMKNWMHYIPQNASVAQVNMPGSHDTGTYGVKMNPEMIKVIFANLDKIYEDKVPAWADVLVKISPLLLSTPPAELALSVLMPILAAALPVVIIELPDIVQYFIDAIAQCNNLTMEQQLNSGLRVFDIRMIYDQNRNPKDMDNASLKGNNKYYEAGFLKICHGTLEEFDFEKYEPDHDVSIADGHKPDGSILTFGDILNDCLNFVTENSSESVYLTYKCEGSDNKKENSNYSKALAKTLAEMQNDDRVVVLKDGDKLPSVGEAKGKVYVVETKQTATYENEYDVSAEKKIGFLRDCFKESETNKLRQNYTKSYCLQGSKNPNVVDKRDYVPRMIYSSTYDIEFNGWYFLKPWESTLLEGTPKDIAIDMGDDSVNHFLDTYGYQRGQYYGWIYMNFPTQMATSNIIFSNIFDMASIVKKSNEGSLFTQFNIRILVCAVVAVLIPAITIPVVKKKKAKKTATTEDKA